MKINDIKMRAKYKNFSDIPVGDFFLYKNTYFLKIENFSVFNLEEDIIDSSVYSTVLPIKATVKGFVDFESDISYLNFSDIRTGEIFVNNNDYYIKITKNYGFNLSSKRIDIFNQNRICVIIENELVIEP